MFSDLIVTPRQIDSVQSLRVGQKRFCLPACFPVVVVVVAVVVVVVLLLLLLLLLLVFLLLLLFLLLLSVFFFAFIKYLVVANLQSAEHFQSCHQCLVLCLP